MHHKCKCIIAQLYELYLIYMLDLAQINLYTHSEPKIENKFHLR